MCKFRTNYIFPWELKPTKKLLRRNHKEKQEFEQQMVVLGNCRHENVGIPWAYYFSETTKFIVYHHYTQGSVFGMLGARRGIKPKWESRLRIAIGAARGIAHIHKQCGGKMAHGNIKSSNIFLNSQGYGLVSDFYFAAGILEKHGPSQESDVYNFGVVLLEIFTRASPMEKAYNRYLISLEANGWDLMRFKQKRIMDELDMLDAVSDLLLAEHLMDSAVKEEFRRTLDVTMNCLALAPGDRPTMAQVVSELEKIMLPQPQLFNQYSNKSGVNKRGWNRFLPFGR